MTYVMRNYVNDEQVDDAQEEVMLMGPGAATTTLGIAGSVQTMGPTRGRCSAGAGFSDMQLEATRSFFGTGTEDKMTDIVGTGDTSAKVSKVSPPSTLQRLQGMMTVRNVGIAVGVIVVVVILMRLPAIRQLRKDLFSGLRKETADLTGAVVDAERTVEFMGQDALSFGEQAIDAGVGAGGRVVDAGVGAGRRVVDAGEIELGELDRIIDLSNR